MTVAMKRGIRPSTQICGPQEVADPGRILHRRPTWLFCDTRPGKHGSQALL